MTVRWPDISDLVIEGGLERHFVWSTSVNDRRCNGVRDSSKSGQQWSYRAL